ncbi:MAG: hypothetical protein AB7Q00_14665 [Phycisphaerales bacterium]
MAEKKHTLTVIAGELNMSTKTLRALLRKKGYKRPGTRWVFSTEEKAEIKALVKKPAKKAAKKSTGRRKAPVADEMRVTH